MSRRRARIEETVEGAENRNPFGAAAGRAMTMADAARRMRWIAIDLNAAAFALFLTPPSGKRGFLVPSLDSSHPGIAVQTRQIAAAERPALVRHLHDSTAPFWWNDGPDCASAQAFARLDWCPQAEPLAPASCGIGFPVQAERGRCGLMAFMGRDMTLAPEALYDIHGRCFALFDQVARLRPGDRLPPISPRELECLKLSANGYTSEEIAKLLKLSVHTTNQYLASTAHKLNAVNRMHAVAKALRLGLIE